MQRMADRALTFANGAALAAQALARGGRRDHRDADDHHRRRRGDIATRQTRAPSRGVRMLTVSRIDPRKGLRVLPEAVRLADRSRHRRHARHRRADGGAAGRGRARQRLREAARRSASADRVSLAGPVPLDRLLPLYRDYDLFVLPTLPGEGIPRVLLEAMAAGLPVVTTRVAGIPSLVTHENNGLLVDVAARRRPSPMRSRGSRTTAPLRRRLIAHGYDTARAHTLEAAGGAHDARRFVAAWRLTLRHSAARQLTDSPIRGA